MKAKECLCRFNFFSEFMKGKRQFSKAEVEEIERLISKKVMASSSEQKSVRRHIRKLGFYASDFGLGGGYTVNDFRSVVVIIGESLFTSKPTNTKVSKLKPKSNKQSDEDYIIDLCDEVLGLQSSRQHRFDFLRGDTGVKLPVDAYYSSLNLVVEYYERQHTERVNFFDKRITSSGISRGEQRKKYDQLRQTELPKNRINLIIFDYSEFLHTSNKRLIKNRKEDWEVIKRKLGCFNK
ncbi:hypothetical protein LB450_08450 [Psychroflexus sp. CAK1W]|uniref:hypothetical protein n=1 Tax=Psychroflexus curvus TaxID=2873595 RepID=UPI001CC90CFC|nr:hypothetical protein [Psychroflexus curvus]MBZ9628126.1 hypothetical protein [Psychroflexus curvus]